MLLSWDHFARPGPDLEQAVAAFRSVERLARDETASSLETVFAVLLATADVHLQRAALFTLVQRAPASLALARELLEREVPTVSRLFTIDVEASVRRAHERSLAAAVLGLSGLPEARAPLQKALTEATNDSERTLFVVALARTGGRAETEKLLSATLARTAVDAPIAPELASGLVQLVPGMEDLLLPCHVEIVRSGGPVLVAEALASAAEAHAVETLAPALIERAGRVAATNPEAGVHLLRAAAEIASESVFASLRHQLHQTALASQKEWLDTWADELGGAFARCAEDLACHVERLAEANVDLSHFKSAQLVAARFPLEQGPAVLSQMERMERPYWLAFALDERLPRPSLAQLGRVRKLIARGPEDAQLYAPHDACARIDSPLEELALRLAVRAQRLE